MKNGIKWFIIWGIIMIVGSTSFPDGSWMTQSGLIVLISGLTLLTLKKRSNKPKNKIILIITEVALLIFATTFLALGFFNSAWFRHPLGLLISVGVWGYVIIIEILKMKNNLKEKVNYK
jgi:protein-S-isoprenylcysteine O-methyltransferase Ste14